MRILHVCAPAHVGGLERVLLALARGHQGRGHDVHVAVVLERPAREHRFADDLSGSGVTVHPLELPRRAYLAERGAIARLCRVVQPEVVHTHGYRPDVVDGGVARRLGLPVVATLHGFTGGGWRNRVYEKLQRLAYRRFDAVVVVSREQARQLEAERVSADRLHRIPNVLPPSSEPMSRAAARRVLGLSGHTRCVGWVGRLSSEKAPDVFLHALSLLERRDIHASLIGAGGEQETVERLVRRLGLERRVTLHGELGGVGALLGAFDVFVLSSRTEGVPIVLLEASAAGVPIVATRVGGIPDVFSDAEAWLVPPDDPGALAQALAEAFEDGARAAARAQAAQGRVAASSYADWLTGYERVYETVMTRRAPRSRQPVPP